MVVTFSAFDMVRLICGLLAVGVLGGIPIGQWLAGLPVGRVDPRDDQEAAQLLEAAARELRRRPRSA